MSHVHKLKFWQLICHDISGVALPPFDEARFQTPHLSSFNSQSKPIHAIEWQTKWGECSSSLWFKLNFLPSFKLIFFFFYWSCLLCKNKWGVSSVGASPLDSTKPRQHLIKGVFLKIVYRHLRLCLSPQVVEMFSFPSNELNFVHFGNKRSWCTCAFSPTIICTDLVYF